MKRANKAFTLIEVLIVLVIISTVAAMTLPNIIQNYQAKITVNKLKKVYSTLQQTYEHATQEYGTPKYWNIMGRNQTTSIIARDKLFSDIRKSAVCNNNTDVRICNLSNSYVSASGKPVLHAEKASISFDGIGVYTIASDSSVNRGNSKLLENVYVLIVVDTNGIKAPNTWGKDTFMFYLSEYGIVPAGTPEETEHGFSTGHYTCYNHGGGCTAWVIQNENMDYLKCSDLSWNGKHKCE